MSALNTTDHAGAILARIIEPEQGDLSEAAAKAILQFRLTEADRNRVNELAASARAGTLTEEERSELDDYERVTALIEFLQSKARRSMQANGTTA